LNTSRENGLTQKSEDAVGFLLCDLLVVQLTVKDVQAKKVVSGRKRKVISARSKQIKRFKIKPFIRIKHNLRIFGVIPFIKYKTTLNK